MAARDVYRFPLGFGIFDPSPHDTTASAVWPKRRRFSSSPVSRSGAAAGLASGWCLRGVGRTALPGEAHHICPTDLVSPSGRGNTVPEMTGKWFTWGDAAASRCYRIVHHAREIARWIRCSRPISGGPIWGMRKGRGGDEAALPRSAGDARISNNIETGMTMAAGQKKTAPKRGATNARRGRPPAGRRNRKPRRLRRRSARCQPERLRRRLRAARRRRNGCHQTARRPKLTLFSRRSLNRWHRSWDRSLKSVPS